MDTTTRLSLNVIILYVKLIVVIVINLLVARLILSALGVEDFGIVNLIAGIVAMLTFIQNSMAVSTQRFLSVNMGKANTNNQLIIFNSSVVLHLILALLLALIIEAMFPFVFDSSIRISAERLHSAQILYHLMVLGTVVTVISVPYDAVLNAHENMLWFSLACITESLIRLGGAIWLLSYQHDKLILYGIILIAIRLVSFIMKWMYCRFRYDDSFVNLKKANKDTMKSMFAFSFWNFFGAIAMTGRNQGVAIILNIFFGVVINAAYGVALQVLGQLSNFTSTIQKALNPQIMKREGNNDRASMLSLALKQSKYSYILLFVMTTPLLIEMPYVLKMWLNDVPEYTVAFCRLILLVGLIQQLTTGLQVAIQARGKIAAYLLGCSITLLLNLPVSYALLKIGMSAEYVIYAMIIIELFLVFVRFTFANKLVGLTLKDFVGNLIIPISIFTISASGVMYAIYCTYTTSNSFTKLVVITLISTLVSIVSAYFILGKSEKKQFYALFDKALLKLQRHKRQNTL